MEFKFKGISWVGDIYQKFEEMCQEDAVKYLGNRVQNVGDSVKRFYSDVQEVLPIPPLVNSAKHGHLSLALNNNVDSPLESVTAVTKNKGWVEENPVNKTIESFHDSDANNLTNNQHAQASVGLDLVNRVHDENFSNSCEVADSCTNREEVGDDYFRETSGIMKKNLNVSLEQNAVKSTPELLNEKEPLESSTFSASLDSLTSSELASSTMPSESSCLSESESLPARSQSSYCSEIDSCKENSVDVARHSLDSSMVVVSCTTTPDEGVAGEFTTSQAGLLSRGSNKSMGLNEGETSVANEVMPLNNLSGTGIKPVQISSAQDRAIIPGSESDERLVNSMESNMEDIQLRDLHPSEDYSVGQFFEDAREATRSILDNGHVPIVVGGTGLYLRWFIYGKPDVPKASLETTSEVYSELAEFQRNEQWDAAVQLVVEAGDPKAQFITPNDWYRLRRSLEIIKSSGSPPSAFRVPYDSFREQGDSSVMDNSNYSDVNAISGGMKETSSDLDYEFICFFLSTRRLDLYRSVDYRCEDMLLERDGLLSEAQWLLNIGLHPNSNSATKAIGYRQAMDYLIRCRLQGGQSSVREFFHFLNEFQKASRNFAKRQLTWFRNEHIYHWLDASKPLDTILDFIDRSYHDHSGALIVPEHLRMSRDASNGREANQLKAYRSKNRLFLNKDDCSPVLDWIRRTQC